MRFGKYAILPLFFALLVLAVPAYAQEVNVQASVSETTIGTEEAVTYSIVVQGVAAGDVTAPRPPEAEGLALLQSAPSTQQSVSIVNGRMSQSVTYKWAYRAAGEGNAVINGTTVQVKGKNYNTQPIGVSVVPQSERPQRQARRRSPLDPFGAFRQPPASPSSNEPAAPQIGKNDIFIRALPSARRVVRNQQVNIEYHLYFREGMQLRQSRLADSWDAEGFWREELDVQRRPVPKTVVENGLRYNTIVLKRVAVFPTHNGTLTVDPLKIEAEAYVPMRNVDPFDQFFSFRQRYEPVEVASPSVRIEVLPIADDAPASFTGAVGSFQLEARVDAEEVEVGETVQVELKLSGTGNIATVELPTFEPPGVFEQYDPQISTSIDRTGNRIRGSKTLTYVLVPRSNGTFQIPEIEMSFYNPARGRFETIRPRPSSVKVTGTPTAPVAALRTSSGLPVDDIAGLLAVPADWKKLDVKPIHQRGWVYGLLLLPLLVLGGFYAQHRYQAKLAGDVMFARGKRAHPVARKHLKKAEELLARQDARAFYEEIERALLSFVGNRLNVAETGMTHQQLDALLSYKDVDAGIRQQLIGLLQECDRVRFAPILPDQAEMNTACDRVSTLIVQLDEIFKAARTS